MILLLLIAFDQPVPSECIIDRCEAKVCMVETPEGWVEIDRKPYHYEGKEIECPLWLIDPR